MLCPNLWSLKSVFFNVLNFASLFFIFSVEQATWIYIISEILYRMLTTARPILVSLLYIYSKTSYFLEMMGDVRKSIRNLKC